MKFFVTSVFLLASITSFAAQKSIVTEKQELIANINEVLYLVASNSTEKVMVADVFMDKKITQYDLILPSLFAGATTSADSKTFNKHNLYSKNESSCLSSGSTVICNGDEIKVGSATGIVDGIQLLGKNSILGFKRNVRLIDKINNKVALILSIESLKLAHR